MMKFPKVILCILDGFGVASPSEGNAISLAKPGFFEELIAYYPTKVLQASGPAVGLPWGERGNSEVGHLNIGAGRVVMQELPRINMAIGDGSFYQNGALQEVMKHVVEKQSTLHLLGLIGTGAVHAYEQHMYALIGMARDQGVKNIALHLFTDGRDAPARAAQESVNKLLKKIKDWPGVQVATVIGRFYAMDRGGHWQQTEQALDAILRGKGEFFKDAAEAIAQRYAMNVTDEMMPPTVITGENDWPQAPVKEGDGAIFFNFRNDRMIQLVQKFLTEAPGVQVLTMTSYNPEFNCLVAFSPILVQDSLSEIISKRGWRQFHAAESEKFAHVTFFFNGHRHEPWPGEERKIVSSPTGVQNYADTPEMAARPLTDEVVERIKSGSDKFILVNYANGDMVGHTGNLSAAVAAVQVLDECLKRLAKAASDAGALLIITADHGNCEMMFDLRTGRPNTEHTANPIPLIFYADELKLAQKSGINLYTVAGIIPEGILPDIGPTILKALGLEVPFSMVGKVIEF